MPIISDVRILIADLLKPSGCTLKKINSIIINSID
jgi:hypothetical protein